MNVNNTTIIEFPWTLSEYFKDTVHSLVNVFKAIEQNDGGILARKSTEPKIVAAMILGQAVSNLRTGWVLKPTEEETIVMQCDAMRSTYNIPVVKSVMIRQGDIEEISRLDLN